MVLSKIEKKITHRKDVVIWALLFANFSKIKVTLATYFFSWAKTIKAIELIPNVEGQEKAAQWCSTLKLDRTNVLRPQNWKNMSCVFFAATVYFKLQQAVQEVMMSLSLFVCL